MNNKKYLLLSRTTNGFDVKLTEAKITNAIDLNKTDILLIHALL